MSLLLLAAPAPANAADCQCGDGRYVDLELPGAVDEAEFCEVFCASRGGVQSRVDIPDIPEIPEIPEVPCPLYLQPALIVAPVNADTYKINVAALDSCSWHVSGGASWASSSPSSGSGNGTIMVSVTENTTGMDRDVEFQVGDYGFGITQTTQQKTCAASPYPGSIVFGPSGGSRAINVVDSQDCANSPTTSETWITAALSGAAPVKKLDIACDPLPTGTAERSGMVSIGDAEIAVAQTNQPVSAAATESIDQLSGYEDVLEQAISILTQIVDADYLNALAGLHSDDMETFLQNVYSLSSSAQLIATSGAGIEITNVTGDNSVVPFIWETYYSGPDGAPISDLAIYKLDDETQTSSLLHAYHSGSVADAPANSWCVLDPNDSNTCLAPSQSLSNDQPFSYALFIQDNGPYDANPTMGEVADPAAIVYEPGAKAAADYTGWWYDPNASGTGLSLETQGDAMFMAWYMYDEQGRPAWYSGLFSSSSPGVYSGDLNKIEGWALGTPYDANRTTSKVGSVTLTFSDADNMKIEWIVDANLASGSKDYRRLLPAEVGAGSYDARDIHGWWIDPAYEGMGFFLEAYGGKMFGAWYHYRDDNTPRWWSMYDDLADGDGSFSASMKQWSGGPILGGQYSAPSVSDVEQIDIAFNADGTATFTRADGATYTLERYDFSQFAP